MKGGSTHLDTAFMGLPSWPDATASGKLPARRRPAQPFPADQTAASPDRQGCPSGRYPRPVFSPQGPSLRELCVQALSSVERGYDLLAPKFDHTPFRTPDAIVDGTADALRPLRPFGARLDVCTRTGAGVSVLKPLCQGPIPGVGLSTRL